MNRLLYASVCLFALLNVKIAEAGQLFPPSNMREMPNLPCPRNGVLQWSGSEVQCVDPTPGVSLSCPSGEVLTGIQTGLPVCAVIPPSNFQSRWPNGIICHYKGPTPYYFWHNYDGNYAMSWTDSLNRAQSEQIGFDPTTQNWNGDFRSSHGNSASDYDCNGKSISELQAAGQTIQ